MALPDKQIIEALAVTAELTGTQLTPAAARVMAQDLAPYPKNQILGALLKCRRELTGRLTIAAIMQRLADGRPSPEEAWAGLPLNEDVSVSWTVEMQQAWGVAMPLLENRDKVGARLAFVDCYKRLVSEARERGEPVKWQISLGHDPNARQAALDEAVRLGRLSAPVLAASLGYEPEPQTALPPPDVQKLIGQLKAISAEGEKS